MPCNPCCEEVPAMASYIAEAESSASCCDFCTIYCCFGLTLFALCLMSLQPFALASIQQEKNHNGLCKIRHQLSNCRFDHTFLAADPVQWSWRPMPFLVIQVLRQLYVCQLFSPCLGPVHSSPRMVRLCYQEAAGQTSKASLSTSNPQLLTNETLAGCSAM